MPEGRMLSKSISCSVQLGEVSIEADYLFARCIPHLDREGRMPGHPSLVKSITCPLRPEITVEVIPSLLQELGAAGLVRWYAVGGREVLEFTGFHNHQKGARFDREAESRFPPYSASVTDLLRTHSGPTPAEVRVSEVKLSEGEVKESEAEAARGASGQATGGEAESFRMKVDLEAYADEHGYGPRDRLIAIGEDITAWRAPSGAVVPATDRLRMLKLADAHMTDPKGKAHDRRSALKYVIAQQYDPFTVAKAEDRPPPARTVQGQQHPPAAAVMQPSVREIVAKQEAEADRYTTWRQQMLFRLRAEPDGVREALDKEAAALIGDVLKSLPSTARARTLEAKALELYGRRIGEPQPVAA